MKEMICDETRRGYTLIGVLGITALALFMLMNIAVAAPFAYIPNNGDDTISVIDTATDTVTATVNINDVTSYDGPHYPFAITVSPVGKKAFVTLPGSMMSCEIDTTTNVITGGRGFADVTQGIAANSDGTKIYAANSLFDRVEIYYTSKSVTVGYSPFGIALSPDEKKVYVTNSGSNNVSVIDTATNTVTATVNVGSTPLGVAVSPDGAKVYVANGDANTVSVIDTATNTVTATVNAGNGPYGVAVSPDGTKAYITNSGSNSVSVIDTAKNTVTATVSVGTDPVGVSVTPDRKKVYVTNSGSNSVSVIDTATNKVIATVSVGIGPIAFGQFIGPAPTINTAPIADAGESYQANEGSPVTFNAILSTDSDGDSLQYRWDFESDGEWDTEWSNEPTITHIWNDNWGGSATLEVSDGELTATDIVTVTISNVNPTIGEIVSPIDPILVNTPITTSCTFTDVGHADTHVGVWDWGDGTDSTGIISEATGAGKITGEHVYTSAGVYRVTFTITDDDDGSTSLTAGNYVIVYNPEGGFVTGGGWINSPAGAYVADNTLTGKATFGFISKYQKGATVPTGKTEFQFKVADLNFRSENYDWLVVAGSQAKYKGTGTINGAGNYGFMLSAVDGAIKGDGVDRFRIKIWDKESNDKIIYDNEIGTKDDAEPSASIGGGSIIIHQEK